MTKLIRKYKEPGDSVTIRTDIQVGTGDITITLTPEEQGIILGGINNGLMFTSPNIVGRDFNIDAHYGYIKLLAKMENAIEVVGIDEHELPGEEAKGMAG